MPILFSLLQRLFFPMSQFWPQIHFDFSHFIWLTSQSPQSSFISHSVHGSTTVDDLDGYWIFNWEIFYWKIRFELFGFERWHVGMALNTLLGGHIKYWTFKIFISTIEINSPCHSWTSVFWTAFIIRVGVVMVIFIIIG